MSARTRLGGFVLAEALVAAALAALSMAFALKLLAWTVERGQSAGNTLQAVRVIERIYEESLADPAAARSRPSAGQTGRFFWSRAALSPDPARVREPVSVVRIEVRWRERSRVKRLALDAVVGTDQAGASRL